MGNLENLLKCSQSCKSTCHEINKEEERVNIEGWKCGINLRMQCNPLKETSNKA